jgi:hypothetical protein
LAFLARPLGRKEFLAEGNELRNRDLIFFAVLQMTRDGNLAADLRSVTLSLSRQSEATYNNTNAPTRASSVHRMTSARLLSTKDQ